MSKIPAIRRRILDYMPDILELTGRVAATPLPGGQREADQIAPLIAACAYLRHDDPPAAAIEEMIRLYRTKRQSQPSDEENILAEIFSAVVGAGKGRYAVGELMAVATGEKKHEDSGIDALEADILSSLERAGLRYSNNKITIRVDSPALRSAAAAAGYAGGYDSILRRHNACLTPDATVRRRMSGHQYRCREFDAREILK